MKSRNQQGSAHLIIIIVLVVVVLGALGVIFWQNFVNKSDDTAKNDATSQKATDEDTTRKLTVAEWGVSGEYTFNKDVSYDFENSLGVELLHLATDVVGALDDCNSSNVLRYAGDVITEIGTGSTGNPEITAKDAYETMTTPNVSWAAKAHVGDYYYFMSKPQSACSEEFVGKEIVTESSDLFDVTKQFVLSLEASK